MAGTIVGILGKQRSGKTLFAYKLVKNLSQAYKLRVYTNIYSPRDLNFVYLNSLRDFPLDLEPKILFLDEIYNGTDAQDYKKLKEISIFINTLGKQNCLFVYTTIEAGMVYNRLRNQTSTVIAVKSDPERIYYKIVNMDKGESNIYSVVKNDHLFQDVLYDTKFIPLDFVWDMKFWNSKLSDFYRKYYGLSVDIGTVSK